MIGVRNRIAVTKSATFGVFNILYAIPVVFLFNHFDEANDRGKTIVCFLS